MRLLDKIKDHILLMDGAMGTYYNQQYGTELEAEEANLVHRRRLLQYIRHTLRQEQN